MNNSFSLYYIYKFIYVHLSELTSVYWDMRQYLEGSLKKGEIHSLSLWSRKFSGKNRPESSNQMMLSSINKWTRGDHSKLT